MSSSVGSNLWLTAVLVAIAAGVCWLLYQTPPSLDRLTGAFLLAIGILNIVLHRRIGRQIFGWAHSMPTVARFWECTGQEGAQLLYLGIGIILAVSGAVLVIKSAY